MDDQGLQDAAIFLMSIGEEEAAEVFKHIRHLADTDQEATTDGVEILPQLEEALVDEDEVAGIEVGCVDD